MHQPSIPDDRPTSGTSSTNPKELSVNDWQVAQIRKSIEQADRGEFATDEEVQRVRNKWASKAR